MLQRRKKLLVQPRLQLVFALTFLSTAGLYVLLQAILFRWTVVQIADELPRESAMILPALMDGLRRNLLLTFAVLVPLTLAIGVLVTFRVAGPLYRFEVFLREIVEGRKPAPCTLRKEDELQELCALLNRAVAPLLGDASESAPARASEGAAVDPDQVDSLIAHDRSPV